MTKANRLLKKFQAGVVQRKLTEQPTKEQAAVLEKDGKALVAELRRGGADKAKVTFLDGKVLEMKQPRVVFSKTTFEAVLLDAGLATNETGSVHLLATVVELLLVDTIEPLR